MLMPAERDELMNHLAIRKAPADEKLRIRVVLGCADGESGKRIARRLKACVQTVSKWRHRYTAYRFAGLSDAPRSGRPRRVLDVQVKTVVDKVRQSMSIRATHWGVRSMSTVTGVSASTVKRIWDVFGLKAHRQSTFKLSTNPRFVDKVRDVMGLNLAPADRDQVLCVDERRKLPALNRTQPCLPLSFGRPAARARPQSARQHVVVCCTGCCYRQSHRTDQSTAS
jgi:transposase